jgi:hypothetical protein
MKQATKHRWMTIAVILIIIAVYNVIVFTIPFTKEGGFWTGYAFSMTALLLTAVVEFFFFERQDLKSRFYGWPLRTVAWRYLIIQLVVGLLEMILTSIPFRYGIALNAVLLGACLIGLIAVSAAKEEIERIDEKIKGKVFYIKSLQADVEGLVDKATDEATKKTLQELVDTIRYSDPMSNEQLAAIENKIEGKTAMLAEAVENSIEESIKALCAELQQLFAERNRKCKMLK